MPEKSGPSAPRGVASYPNWNLNAPDLDAHETKILQILGAALVSHWFEVPRDLQKILFNQAAVQFGADTSSLKGNLARFLHDNAP
ncbi:hypothetical protein [Asticcacaulis sp. AND118]|uniref:hypothetical protein n=1 Tax=Asticcacaulis sp. AND118 TaxID=2840468 RepID=UPI001CFFEC47|nr:hypothetical protein [Asticcacaulis sp. AND118]UDF05581.1 hypothetical protein LH365_15420 [Asticcacaulis sp. AND118]